MKGRGPGFSKIKKEKDIITDNKVNDNITRKNVQFKDANTEYSDEPRCSDEFYVSHKKKSLIETFYDQAEDEGIKKRYRDDYVNEKIKNHNKNRKQTKKIKKQMMCITRESYENRRKQEILQEFINDHNKSKGKGGRKKTKKIKRKRKKITRKRKYKRY